MQQARRARVGVLLRHALEREDGELARVVEPVLADRGRRRGSGRSRRRATPPISSASGIASRSRSSASARSDLASGAERERAQVLELVEGVAGPLEPVARLEPEPLRLVDLAQVVLDEPELERRSRLVAEAAEPRRASARALDELLLGADEIADVVEQRPSQLVDLDLQSTCRRAPPRSRGRAGDLRRPRRPPSSNHQRT